jgi:hypothetical protein
MEKKLRESHLILCIKAQNFQSELEFVRNLLDGWSKGRNMFDENGISY